ncbi:MAG: energy transducer TonB [Acidobacteriota bacterium]
MFETSVVQAQGTKARGRFGLLTASIIAHTAVAFGAVAVSIASVDFPITAPDEYQLPPVVMTVRIPPPLGNPNGGAPPKPAQPAPVKPAAPPAGITAPPTIPDTVTPVASESPVSGDANPNPSGTEPGPIGVPWGQKDSIGDLDAPPVPIGVPVQVEEKIYQPYEVKAPVLLRRVEPRYPQSLVRTGLSATVVVRCIIDKNGHVQNPEVIVPASMPPFNGEVMRVISQWRFTPGSVRGQAVDSYFDLTVRFAVTR